MDATSHFESATDDVLRLYKQINGKDMDLTNLPEDDEWSFNNNVSIYLMKKKL